MNRKQKETIFNTLAVLSAIAALYHIAGIFYKVNDSPVWRHSLFIFINLICTYGLLKRPAWFVWFFLLLLLQQLYSHGSDIIRSWKNDHPIDWISIVVVILMPLAFILLLKDRTSVSRKSDV
ncbi:MAG: hypothetical protein WDO16_12675 [Bacteroidota bacterium]